MMDLLGIELMHYYMAHTSLSLMSRPTDHGIHLMQVLGPRAALHFSPLLHGIFSLAALHIHIAENDFKGTRSEKDFLGLTDHYLSQCLAELPATIAPAKYGSDEFEPLFMTYTFLSLISVGHPQLQLHQLTPGPAVDPAYIYHDHPLAWLGAARFFQIKMLQHWDPYSEKERPILESSPHTILEVPYNDQPMYNGLLAFPALLRYINLDGAPDSSELADPTLVKVYDGAIKQLRQLWAVSSIAHEEQMKIIMWPFAMHSEFFQLVMNKRPRVRCFERRLFRR